MYVLCTAMMYVLCTAMIYVMMDVMMDAMMDGLIEVSVGLLNVLVGLLFLVAVGHLVLFCVELQVHQLLEEALPDLLDVEVVGVELDSLVLSLPAAYLLLGRGALHRQINRALRVEAEVGGTDELQDQLGHPRLSRPERNLADVLLLLRGELNLDGEERTFSR
jgi:hypothetical protein